MPRLRRAKPAEPLKFFLPSRDRRAHASISSLRGAGEGFKAAQGCSTQRGHRGHRRFPCGIQCLCMQTAEVVIIGGGIVGSSIAYHLTAAGCKDVLVIERETAQGKGSTGKSMGGVRAQFSTPVNIQMSLYSIPFYASFDERLGYPADYRPQGYLFCATKEKHLTYLRTNYEKQVAMGLKSVRLISGDEIRDMFPELRGDDIVGGSFCPSDGFVDPYSVMIGFMTWAVDNGARLWKNTQVTGIDRDAQGIFNVQTSRGPVSTRKVVNAAGAWSRSVGAMAGVDLPVEPLRRMIVPTEPFDQFPHSA